MAFKKTVDKESSKRAPLFAKLLETHFPVDTKSDQSNDTLETKKYPNDNADLTHVPANIQVIDVWPTDKKCDTIWVTLKYPSDKDEFMTLKYPSDSDEDYKTHLDYIKASAVTSIKKDIDIVTLKYPSDRDEFLTA